MKELRQTIMAWLAGRRYQRKARKMERVREMARETICVKDFNGRIFLCYGDVPLLKGCDVKGNITGTLEKMRRNFTTFYTEGSDGNYIDDQTKSDIGYIHLTV